MKLLHLDLLRFRFENLDKAIDLILNVIDDYESYLSVLKEIISSFKNSHMRKSGLKSSTL